MIVGSYWKCLRQRWLTACVALAGFSASFAGAQSPADLPKVPPVTIEVVQPAPDPRAPAAPAHKTKQTAGQKEALPGTKEVLPVPPTPVPAPAPAPVVEAPSAGCSSCGSGHGRWASNLFSCSSCGSAGNCYAGRLHPCSCCTSDTALGRLACGLYHCLCCPDPCYEPRWIAQQNAAFFVDPVRPSTQTRIRWDHVNDHQRPDRAEFFWARIGGKGPANPETGVNYDVLSFYQEIAPTPGFSLFFEMPYVSTEPDVNPGRAGFGDLNLGTKSVLLDCELLLVAFQFRTYILTGSPGKGLGTGHVSLEPSLLAALKLTPDAYLQGQVAEWIPIGGTGGHQGGVLHYHLAYNQVIGRILPDVPLIGTLEFNGYTFHNGEFTNELGVRQGTSGDSYFTAGPGLRLSICDRVDFGTAVGFGFGDQGPGQVFRSEFRFRF